MELKKNDRVMYRDRLGTVMSELGYYKVIEKNTWIDVLLDGEEHICQIRKDYLKKVNNNIHTYENETNINVYTNELNEDFKNKFKTIVKEIVENNMLIPIKEDEKILTKNKLHNLEMYKEIDLPTMLMKLAEESMEVSIAIMNEDKENLIEELLDVMQVCMGIAYTQNINLYENIEKHNEKLLSRGHKFI